MMHGGAIISFCLSHEVILRAVLSTNCRYQTKKTEGIHDAAQRLQDTRINAGVPEVEATVAKHAKKFEKKVYPGANHAFMNFKCIRLVLQNFPLANPFLCELGMVTNALVCIAKFNGDYQR